MRCSVFMYFFALSYFYQQVRTVNSNCMRLTTFNYHYTSPYDLRELDSKLVENGLCFNFSIKAPSNGHILLTSTPDSKESFVKIEVVIGAGANTFSSIRRKPKITNIDYSVNSPGILSSNTMKPFSLILQGSILELYSNDNSLPILHYEDSVINDMNYISFGAWNNVGVEWSFDCKDAEVPEETSSDPLSRLKNDLWSKYNPFYPPIVSEDPLIVNVSLHLIHINLNAKDALFSLRGKFEITWTDQTLLWDPEEYENITHLNLRHRVIWMPDLVLMDIPQVDKYLLEEKNVRLNFNGDVHWSSLAISETWCNVDMTNWPNDQHTCVLHIGLHSHPETVQLKLTNSPDKKLLQTSGLEWEVMSISSEEIRILDTEDGSSQSFKLRVTMKRIKTPYFLLFILPLLVTFIVLCATFTIAPRHKSRLILVSSCILLLYVLLLSEVEMLPALSQASPRVVKTTSSLLLLAVIQLIFHSFNFHIAKNTFPAPHFVQKAAGRPWMKYLQRAAYESFVSDNRKENEGLFSETEETAQQNSVVAAVMNKYHWTLVSRTLDIFIFILSFILLPFLIVAV